MSPQMTVLAGTAAALLSPATFAAPSLEIGEPFPALVLPSMTDDKPMSIADFRGRKVILQVFASW